MANITAAIKIAKALSELLNQDIGTMDVHDKMFLIEQGYLGENDTLGKFVGKYMYDYMTPKDTADRKRLKELIS